MKRRVTKVLNFFAFNLLFFALYLNFIHKDNNGVQVATPAQTTNTIQGTVLVEHPEQYLNKGEGNSDENVTTTRIASLKHSFN